MLKDYIIKKNIALRERSRSLCLQSFDLVGVKMFLKKGLKGQLMLSRNKPMGAI